MQWKTIDDSTPQDELILLRSSVPDIDTPLVVVGELTTFKGKLHHLWRGTYDKTVVEFRQHGFKDVFQQWCEL